MFIHCFTNNFYFSFDSMTKHLIFQIPVKITVISQKAFDGFNGAQNIMEIFQHFRLHRSLFWFY